MKQSLIVEKALRILKKNGISQGEVADNIGYSEGYISKVSNGEKALTKKFYNAFVEKYGEYVQDAVVIEDPAENTAMSELRLEAKVDALAMMMAAYIESGPERERKDFMSKFSALLASVQNQSNDNKIFSQYTDLAKMNAVDRARKLQQED